MISLDPIQRDFILLESKIREECDLSLNYIMWNHVVSNIFHELRELRNMYWTVESVFKGIEK